jgi:hypothetical protein
MALFTAVLADYCADHLGVVCDTELRALGITEQRTRALVDASILIPVHRHVYRLRSTPVTLESRGRAICLASPTAVITGRAGGKLWGVRRMGVVDTIDVRAAYFANTFVDPTIRL